MANSFVVDCRRACSVTTASRLVGFTDHVAQHGYSSPSGRIYPAIRRPSLSSNRQLVNRLRTSDAHYIKHYPTKMHKKHAAVTTLCRHGNIKMTITTTTTTIIIIIIIMTMTVVVMVD